jgi:SAM-dependent methyltransferase
MTNEKHHNTNDKIQRVTINHYNLNAESFWQGTRDHDVSQNISAFLSALPKDRALDILDFGCGPGRDLATFKQLGHRPIGLDGSETFCIMAQQYSGCNVLNQDFLNLDIKPNSLDGIYANASMFHIPSQELPKVLAECHQALRPKGILFTSNPRGEAEGWQGERYGHYMEFERSKLYLEQAGFSILEHYYRPKGKPRHEQPWLAIVSQKN